MRVVLRLAGIKNKVLIVTLLLLLVVFAAGLATESQPPRFLGKNVKIWFAILASGAGASVILVAMWRSSSAARFIKRTVLLAIITLALLEGSGFLFPKIWPVRVLLVTPNWVKEVLPDSAFDRANFRTPHRDERIDDPELGYRYTPNKEIEFIQAGIRWVVVTDSEGFRVADQTLYANADVVVTGDSFVMGDTVEFDEAWPQQLSQISGLRVLNLCLGGFGVYQYPRVLERYAAEASPGVILVGLTSANDLADPTYDYEDYRRNHVEAKGYSDIPKDNQRWLTEGLDRKNYVLFLYDMASNIAPFSISALTSMRQGEKVLCEFELGGSHFSFDLYTSFQGRSAYVPGEKSRHLDRVRRDLGRVMEFGADIGSQVYFVYMPNPDEIYIPLLESATELNQCASSLLSDYKSGRINLNKFYEQYVEALGPTGSNLLLNPTPFLQQFAARGEQLAWPGDTHPTPLGHKRIAQFVAARIGNQTAAVPD